MTISNNSLRFSGFYRFTSTNPQFLKIAYRQIVSPEADAFGEQYRDSFESKMRRAEPAAVHASLITQYKGKIIGLYGQTVKSFADFCRMQKVPDSDDPPVVPPGGRYSVGIMKADDILMGKFLADQKVKVSEFTPLEIAAKRLE